MTPSTPTPRPGGRTLLLVALAVAACAEAPTAPTAPARTGPVDLALEWRRGDPGALGMDASAVERVGRAGADVTRLRSLLVVRNGRLVLERYYGGVGADDVADVRSVTKSVVSLLVGIALERGELPGLDATLGDLLPAAVGPLPEEQRAITVEHLLTMTGGWAWDESDPAAYDAWATSPDPVAYLLARPLADPPGTRFRYNSAAVHLLGVVLEGAVGPLEDYAARHLFSRIGIARAVWEVTPDGRVNGGSGLDLRPRDLARLGQLALQEGRSGSAQVVPADHVRAATSNQSGWTAPSGPTTVSYGYLWWTDETNRGFMAWGFGGQFIYVAPERDLVVVATTRWRTDPGEAPPTRVAAEVLDFIVTDVLPTAPPM